MKTTERASYSDRIKMAVDAALETNKQTPGEMPVGKTSPVLETPEPISKNPKPDDALTPYAMGLAGKVRAGELKQDFDNKSDESVPVGPGHTTAPTQLQDTASLSASDVPAPKDDMPVMDKESNVSMGYGAGGSMGGASGSGTGAVSGGLGGVGRGNMGMPKLSSVEPPLKAAARLLLVKEAMGLPSPF